MLANRLLLLPDWLTLAKTRRVGATPLTISLSIEREISRKNIAYAWSRIISFPAWNERFQWFLPAVICRGHNNVMVATLTMLGNTYFWWRCDFQKVRRPWTLPHAGFLHGSPAVKLVTDLPLGGGRFNKIILTPKLGQETLPEKCKICTMSCPALTRHHIWQGQLVKLSRLTPQRSKVFTEVKH